MTARSLFRIYSMTKPITAVAVMMLHDEGRFRLDDAVSKYLPEFGDLRVGTGAAARPPARAVTVEDLLLHTSGLSHRTSDLYRELQVRSRADTLPPFITKITRAPLMEDPGRASATAKRPPCSGVSSRCGRSSLSIGSWRSGCSAAEDDRHAVLGAPGRSASAGDGVRPGTRRRVGAGRDRSGALHRAACPHRRRGGAGLDGPGLHAFCPDAVERGQSRRRPCAPTVPPGASWPTAFRPRSSRPAAARWAGAWGTSASSLIPPVSHIRRRAVNGWDGTAGTIFWNDPAAGTAIVLMTQSSPANPATIRQRFKTLVQGAVRSPGVAATGVRGSGGVGSHGGPHRAIQFGEVSER